MKILSIALLLFYSTLSNANDSVIVPSDNITPGDILSGGGIYEYASKEGASGTVTARIAHFVFGDCYATTEITATAYVSGGLPYIKAVKSGLQVGYKPNGATCTLISGVDTSIVPTTLYEGQTEIIALVNGFIEIEVTPSTLVLRGTYYNGDPAITSYTLPPNVSQTNTIQW